MHFAHLQQSGHVVVDDRSWHHGLLSRRLAHSHAAEVVCSIGKSLVDFMLFLKPEIQTKTLIRQAAKVRLGVRMLMKAFVASSESGLKNLKPFIPFATPSVDLRKRFLPIVAG